MPDYTSLYTGEDLDETIQNYLNIKTNNNSILTPLSTPGTTGLFLRGDGLWSTTLVGNLTATKFIGNLEGNADTATELATAGGTGLFYRGDKTWSNQLEGNLDILGTWFDASKADNDVSAITYPTSFNILDKRGLICARLEAAINPNGNISSYWYIRNYDTSGTQVGQKGIQMTMTKSGTFTYSISDTANFRTAIDVPTRTGGNASGTWDINISGNATTASRLQGFINSGTSAITWGNQTGTTVYWGSSPNSADFEFRRDNPSTGKLSLKLDGRFYFNEGNTPCGGLVYANNYWGETGPDGLADIWIRTTTQGIIPYQSGGVSAGHQYLGTSTWYFFNSYVLTAYASNHASGSSILIKENISTIEENDAKKILLVRPVKFDYKEEFGGLQNQYGVIAEEVENILPSLVIQPPEYDKNNEEECEMHKNDIKAIDYGKFTPHLIRLCQIQQEEINLLKQEVQLLKGGNV